jgi:hypothetical protein
MTSKIRWTSKKKSRRRGKRERRQIKESKRYGKEDL